MSQKPTRVAIYARVSTTGKGQDADLQVDELLEHARERGWAVVKVAVDDGASGAKRDRAALQDVLEEIERGRVDVLLIWKLDRLARSLNHLLEVAEFLRARSVELVSTRDAHIDTTTPAGRFTLQILGAVAELERTLIQERVQAGVDRARAEGKHCGRPRVLVDPRAVESMLVAGHPVSAIAAALGVSRRTVRRRILELELRTR